MLWNLSEDVPSGGHDLRLLRPPSLLKYILPWPLHRKKEKKRGKLFDRTAPFFKESLGIINGGAI